MWGRGGRHGHQSRYAFPVAPVLSIGRWFARVGHAARLLVPLALLALIVPWAHGHAFHGQIDPPPPGPRVAIAAGRAAETIVFIPIKGRITRFVAVSVQRRINEARQLGAGAVVIDLDSQEADLGAASDITQILKDPTTPRSIAWINPKAIGGAAMVALACTEIAAGDGAELGEIMSPRTRDDSKRGHANQAAIASQLLADAVDSARRRGWDEFLVQAMVMPGVELWRAERPGDGTRMCVDAGEYRYLTGTSPARERAELITGRGRPFPGVGPLGEIDSGPPLKPVAPSDPTAFMPASRAVATVLQLGGLQNAGALVQGSIATRRVSIAQSDAGAWNGLGFVCDGSGASILRGPQLAAYGLSSMHAMGEDDFQRTYGAKTMVRLEPSWSEQLAGILNSSIAKGILIAIFLIAMFFEMTHPGMVLPGVVAATTLLLIIGPAFIAGLASWWAIAAIAVGVVLLAMELFVIPGFGIAGILGLVSLFVGLVFTFVPGSTGAGGLWTPEAQDELLRGVITVLLSAITAIFGIFFALRHLGTLPILEKYVLRGPGDDESEMILAMGPRRNVELFVGDEGVAATALRPSGKAMFGDTLVDVVSESGFVESGTPVRVVSAGRMRIAVETIRQVSNQTSKGPPLG